MKLFVLVRFFKDTLFYILFLITKVYFLSKFSAFTGIFCMQGIKCVYSHRFLSPHCILGKTVKLQKSLSGEYENQTIKLK